MLKCSCKGTMIHFAMDLRLCLAHLHPRILVIVRMTNAAGLQPYLRRASVFHHTMILNLHVKMERLAELDL